MARTAWALALWAGCASEGMSGSESGTGPVGACGDLTEVPSIEISGRVRDDQANWVPDVQIVLEERNWSSGTIHGQTRSDANGAFTFSATDLPVVEDCWGTAVSYWLVGETSSFVGDKPMNPYLLEAIDGGTFAVDFSDVPMIVYPR